jgi:hypothetical protein
MFSVAYEVLMGIKGEYRGRGGGIYFLVNSDLEV